MILNQELKNIKKVIINLQERKDKRKYIKHHLEKRFSNFEFYITNRHPTSAKRGCLESHLNVIKKCIEENKFDKLLIFEDDAQMINSISTLKKVPDNWDMLYLGGTVFRVLEKNIPGWTKVQTWTTHAYIINLNNKELISDILKMENYDGEIDRFYLEKIHPKYNCYMADPMICIQKGGYSDIEGREVDYSFMTQTLKGLRVPEHQIDQEGNYVLKLPNIEFNDLPFVSIITPTYKRKELFKMALYNLSNFFYPHHKIEWVVVEDITNDMTQDDTAGSLLPKDEPLLKYIQLDAGDEPYTIAMKRNIGVSNASHKYIVHMDDDDIYEEYTLLSKIKLLMKYENQGIECVGSTMIGTYDIINNISSMASDGPISLSEASMAYLRSFWDEKGFDENCLRGEHKSFTEGRLQKIMDIPYSFSVIALIHKNNFTNQIRDGMEKTGLLRFSDKSDKNGQIANFLDTFNDDRQLFLLDLRDELIQIYKK